MLAFLIDLIRRRVTARHGLAVFRSLSCFVTDITDHQALKCVTLKCGLGVKALIVIGGDDAPIAKVTFEGVKQLMSCSSSPLMSSLTRAEA